MLLVIYVLFTVFIFVGALTLFLKGYKFSRTLSNKSSKLFSTISLYVIATILLMASVNMMIYLSSELNRNYLLLVFSEGEVMVNRGERLGLRIGDPGEQVSKTLKELAYKKSDLLTENYKKTIRKLRAFKQLLIMELKHKCGKGLDPQGDTFICIIEKISCINLKSNLVGSNFHHSSRSLLFMISRYSFW